MKRICKYIVRMITGNRKKALSYSNDYYSAKGILRIGDATLEYVD